MKITKNINFKNLLITLTPTIVVLFLFSLGFVSCYFVIDRVFENQIQKDAKAHTLGRLLKEGKEREQVARVYHDSARALNLLDDISWAVPNIPTPFVGTAPTPGQNGVAHINKLQFRAREELTSPKPGKTYRIFITGGSTAYGSGAPSDETTIAGYLNTLLEKQLTPTTKIKYEVLTMANPAWASTQERIVIENLLSELEPDMVISFSGVNDVHWGMRGRNILWFRSYSDEFFLSLIKKIYWLTGQPDIPENTEINPNGVSPAMVAERLLKNIRISAFALSEKNADYVFVLQPNLTTTSKKLTEREGTKLKVSEQSYFRDCYVLLVKGLNSLQGRNFQFIDLSGAFDSLKENEDIFIDSYHFGDRGNQKIAENLFLKIKGRISGGG
jgi:hypothetical protein